MAIGQGVTLKGFHLEPTIWTWNLSGSPTKADIGKAVSQNTSVARTAKLTGDGDTILGVLATVENRVAEGVVVGAVELHGGFELEYTGTAPTIGSSVVGSATPGKVKVAGDATATYRNRVVSVDQTANTVEVIFF